MEKKKKRGAGGKEHGRRYIKSPTQRPAAAPAPNAALTAFRPFSPSGSYIMLFPKQPALKDLFHSLVDAASKI